nr:ribonuclease H-like domain-containing protein [Tanacetum cinerariifolium]
MFEKEKDPEAIKQKNSHKPIDYVKLNQLSEDFGKRFIPQQELSAEQTFWYHMSNPSTESSDASPVKMKAPKELLKVSLVNESLKKLKFHLTNFDKVVKIRTTPDARTKDNFDENNADDIQDFTSEILQEHKEEVPRKYVLPLRSNRGVPPKRYSPEKTTRGAKYPMANIAEGNLSNKAKAFAVKENQEKDKIGSKPDKNGKRGEAGKSQKQLQLKEEEKPKKTKKEWPKTHARIKSY